MDLSTICTNCFMLKGGTAVCPHCGKIGAPEPEEAYHLPPGTVLNEKYLIGAVVDSGGFGVIYKALDLTLNITVAIKEFFSTSLMCRVPGTLNISVFSGEKRTEYEKGLKRFLEEARIMANFPKNPNIVNVIGYFTENRTAYIVMEYLEGVSFEKYIKENGNSIPIDEAASVIKSVLEGLKVLHGKNIYHRDINPRNIMLTVDNRIKIIDFGTAKFIDEPLEQRTSVVSDGYAPPEQYAENANQGPFTDIYSVGATFYRAVVGEVPLIATERQIKDSLKKPSELITDIPEHIDIAIMKALAVKPQLRFSSSEEMLEAISTENSNIDYPEVEEKKKVRRRTFIVLSSLATVLTVLIAVLIITQRHDGLFDSVKNSIGNNESITVFVPCEDDEKDDLNKIYEKLSDDFIEYSKVHFGKKIEVEYEVVSENEYKNKILSEIDKGNKSFVYRSDVFDSGNIKKEKLDLLYDDCQESLLFLDKYKEYYEPELERIPAGFNVCLLYLKKSLIDSYNTTASWNKLLSDLPATESIYTSGNVYPALYMTLKNENASNDVASKLLWRTLNNGRLADSQYSLKEFTDNKHYIYIGTVNESKEIKKNYLSLYGGGVKNLYSNNESWYGFFCEEWSVATDENESKNNAAVLYLKYYLNKEGQETVKLGNNLSEDSMSLCPEVLETQAKFNTYITDIYNSVDSVEIISPKSESMKFAEKFIDSVKGKNNTYDDIKSFSEEYFN